MLRINLIKDRKVCPAVWYTHCLLNRPVKSFVYKKFPFKSQRAMTIFAKIMAMFHDYIICPEKDYGIQYGTFSYFERK